MAELIAARAFDVRTALAKKYAPTPVDIDPQTAQLSVRIPRPTTAFQAAAWPATTFVAVRVGIEVDGKRTGFEAVYPGGIQRDKNGNIITECGPTWNVETGFYGPMRDDPAQWSKLRRQRLGETGTVVKAWAEVEILNGDRLAGTIAVDGTVQAAPTGETYHRSVSIENSTSGSSGASEAASATISSFTANTGTNRAAFVFGCGNTGNSHTMSNTYGGSSASLTAAESNSAINSFDRIVLDVFNDTEIGSGAKNIVTSSATNNSAILIGVAVFSGVDQTTPYVDVQKTGQDSGTSITVTHTTGASDEYICSFQTVWNANATPAANQTEFLSDIGTTSWGFMNASTQVPTTDSTPSWSWSGGNESSLVSLVVNAASAGTTVTPTTASLTITTYAPTVTASDNKTVTPSTATLTLTTFAPTVTASDHKTVTPTTASLTLTTFAPNVSTGTTTTVTPSTATLTLTTYAPTVSVSDNQSVTPATATLTLTTYAPTVTASDHKTVTPSTATLTITTYAPTVTASDHKSVTPTTATLVITTYAPTVTVALLVAVTPSITRSVTLEVETASALNIGVVKSVSITLDAEGASSITLGT